MPAEPVDVNISITTTRGSVMAALVFTSNSREPVYIDRINGCLDGAIRNNVFTIESDGVPVPYTGIFAKRSRPGPEDVVTLQPGGSITTMVDLTKSYAFLPGTHTYAVYYSAFHQYPDRPGFIELRSKSVSWTFTGK